MVLGASVALADPAGGSNTVITAEQLTVDYKRSIAVFEGNVHVQDPDIVIDADRMVVLFDNENTVKSVTATGRVRLKHQDKRATCTKAIYVEKTGEVVLTGDAVVNRGKDELHGDRITFWINEERMVCEPGRLTIFPSPERRRRGSGLPRLSPETR